MPMNNQTSTTSATGTSNSRPLSEWMSQLRQMQKAPVMTGPVPVMSLPPAATLTKGTGASGVTITAGGTGYVSGESLTVTGGAFAAPARLRITGVDGSGAITSVAVTTPGVYTTTPSNPASVTGGSGTGATFTLTWNVGVASSIGGVTWSRTSPVFKYIGYAPKDVVAGYRGNTTWGVDTQAIIEFVSDAPVLDFRFVGYNSQYDLFVDGQRIANRSVKTDSSGQPHIYTVDWSGVVKPRTYRLSGLNMAFGGVVTGGNYGVWYPAGSNRPFIWQLGDSYTFGNGATQANFAEFRVMCDMLGLDGIADGIGGAGWTSSGSTQPQQRIQNKLTSITFTPEIITLALGYNDAAGGNISRLQTNWRESVALIRQLCPLAKVIQIGPATPIGSTGQISAVRTALMDLCAEADIPFIDVNDWVNANNKQLYTDGDLVHPNDAGHWFRGSRLAAAISELTGFGIATPYRDALDNLNFSAGDVTTLPAGSPATATLRTTPTGQKLDLGIPAGGSSVISEGNGFVAVVARMQSAAQSVPNATDTVINYDTADSSLELNPASAGVSFANGRVTNTSTAAVTLLVSAQNVWQQNTAGYRQMWLRMKDGTRLGSAQAGGTAGEGTMMNIETVVTLKPADYFDVMGWQDSGGTLSINGTSTGLTAPYVGRLLIARLQVTGNNNITIGTVTTLAAGEPARAEITGDAPNQVLNLWLPEGAPGTGGGAPLATNYDKLDTTKALTGAATEPRILSAISEAQATRRQVGQWDVAANTPTLTDPPNTYSGITLGVGDYVVATTAGTRFGVTWAVGDVAKVVLATDGVTLAWYKDPTVNDKFDSKDVIVSQSTGSDAFSGSMLRPKATLAGGLSVVAQPGAITLKPGSYTAAALTVTKQNINVIGSGVSGNNNVEIVGGIITGATRFRLKNVFFTNSASPAFTWNDASGRHNLEQVSISDGQVGPAFVASATASGWAVIASCDFTGSIAASSVVLNNLNAGLACTTRIVNTSGVRLSVGTGHTVYVLACPDLQIVSNNGTIVYLDNLLVRSVLTSQAQLTALLADTSTSTDGYYICDFASPTVGARGDLLLKISVNGIATSVAVHRSYANCPATLPVMFGATTQTLFKYSSGWKNLGDIYPASSTITATRTLTAWGGFYDVTAGTTAVNITLPAITTTVDFSQVQFRRTEKTTGTVTITPPSGVTINGSASVRLEHGQIVKIRAVSTTDLLAEFSERIPAVCLIGKRYNGQLSGNNWWGIQFPSNASGFSKTDPLAMHNAGTEWRIDIKRSGTYEISAGYRVQDTNNVTQTGIWLKTNGADSGLNTWVENATWSQNICQATWTVYLNAGDYIEVLGQPAASTSGTIDVLWAYFNAKMW